MTKGQGASEDRGAGIRIPSLQRGHAAHLSSNHLEMQSCGLISARISRTVFSSWNMCEHLASNSMAMATALAKVRASGQRPSHSFRTSRESRHKTRRNRGVTTWDAFSRSGTHWHALRLCVFAHPSSRRHANTQSRSPRGPPGLISKLRCRCHSAHIAHRAASCRIMPHAACSFATGVKLLSRPA